MSARRFNMRLDCHYSGDDNSIGELTVEHIVEGDWVPLQLGLRTPGFDVYLYSLLTCQHTYLRLNAAEQGIALNRSHGELEIIADDDWSITAVNIRFRIETAGSTPGEDLLQHIIERMRQCPVSKNLQSGAASHTTLSLA